MYLWSPGGNQTTPSEMQWNGETLTVFSIWFCWQLHRCLPKTTRRKTRKNVTRRKLLTHISCDSSPFLMHHTLQKKEWWFLQVEKEKKTTEQVSCRVSLWLEELSWNAVVTVTSSGQHRALAFPGLLLNPTPCTWVQEAAGDTAGITGRKNSSALAKGKRMSQHHQETKQRQLEAKEAASAEGLKHGNTCNGTASQSSLQLGNTSFHNCPWGWWGEDQRWIKTLWSTHSLHLRRRNRFQTWMTLWWHPTPNNCLIWWKILRIPND